MIARPLVAEGHGNAVAGRLDASVADLLSPRPGSAFPSARD